MADKLTPGSLDRQYGVGALGHDTLSLYNLLLTSPSFMDFLNRSAITGQGVQLGINRNLAAAGLNTSGTGAVQGALGGGVTGALQSAGRAQLFDTASHSALENLLARLSAYSNYATAKANQPSFLSQLAGSLIGAGGYAAGAALGKK